MKVLLIVLMIVLSACSPISNNNFNNSEPTLQSAEDANTTQFTEESFR